jgi:hypothetical protein
MRDIVDGWRLHQRQPERTWPAIDRGGVFNTTETSRCGTMSEDGACDIFGLLTLMAATCARRKQRHDFESQWWSADCSGSWGQGISSRFFDDNSRDRVQSMSRASSLEVPMHKREACCVAGWCPPPPRARESGWLRIRWSSRRRVVDLVAAARWRWVPHDGGPFGAVLLAPRFLYRRWFPLKWFSLFA